MTYKEVLDYWITKKPIRSGKTLWLMIARAIEKADKYAWHDLRKDPEDLPKIDGIYWVHGVWGSGKQQEGECEYKLHDGYFSASWNFNIIAWKEIEPFEEV